MINPNSKILFFTEENSLLTGKGINYFTGPLTRNFLRVRKIKRLCKNFNVKVFCFNKSSRDFLNQQNIDNDLIIIDEEIHDQFSFDSMNLVRESLNIEHFHNLTTINDFSWWEILDGSIYHNFAFLMRGIATIGNEIKSLNPDEVIITDLNSRIGKIIKEYCNNTKIKVNKLGFQYSAFKGIARDIYYKTLGFYPKSQKNISALKVPKKSPTNKKTIIFFTDEVRHFDQTVSFLKNLINQYNIIICGSKWQLKNQLMMQKKWENEGFHFTFIEDYGDKKLVKNLKKHYSDIRSKIHELFSRFSKDERYNFEGINLFKLLGKDYSRELFFRAINTNIFYTLTSKVIDCEKPSLGIFMCDLFWWERSIIESCKHNKVKTLMVQHGFKVNSPVLGYTKVDKMALFGNYTRELLIETGIDEDLLKITGRPQWDIIPKYKSNKLNIKKSLKKELGLDFSKKVVVFLSEPHRDQDKALALFEMVYSTMDKLKNFHLISKLHPNEEASVSRSVAKKFKSKIIITQNSSLFEILSVSDLAITQSSLTGLESMFFDIPLLTLNITNSPEIIPFAENGASIGISDEKDLKETLNLFEKNNILFKDLRENQAVFINEHSYKIDGGSSERVSNLVVKMLNENN